MAKLGGIYISVGAKTTQLARDFRKAKGMAKKTAVLMQHEIDSISFKQVSVAAIAFGAVVAFGMKKAIDAASDLEETIGKFDVVFAEHSQQAEEMAEILVGAYAMSEREAKQYLSSVQDLLVPMGMVSDQAIIMANEVVKLAADLGSFNNLPTATVMLDIQSALVGNFETMKKYGVVLNETVIKQEALNLGLWNGKGMVDANTKAQIAYRLMLKGSEAAIGDQQRTMGSYANQMKQYRANIEDISASIGDKLLPQVTEWVSQVNIAIKQNPEIIEQIGEFSKNILDLASAMGKVILFGVEFFNVFVATSQAMGLASTGYVTWTEALLNGVEVVKRFNAEQDGLIFKIDKSTEGYEKYIKALSKTPSASPGLPTLGKPGIIKEDPLSKSRLEAFKEDERLLSEKWQQEIEFMNAQIEKEKEAESARLEIVKEFNEQFNELGKTRFDLERDQIERMTEIYREAGVEENRIAKLASDKNIQIARAEQMAKLDIYQNIAGGIAGTFQMIAQAGGKQSKEAFVVYKAAAMAQAAIAGHQAILQALASAPPPLNFALAAVTGAATAVQIGMIAASQPPSYDQGGISKPGEIYQTGPIRELHIPMTGKVPVDINGGQETAPQEIVIMNTVDPSVMDRYMASSRGQNAIMNVIGSNPQAIRRLSR